MMSFRKIGAASSGHLVMAYFTENSPDREPMSLDAMKDNPDSGGRLTNYYTGRDTRASWRKNMTPSIARALGINPSRPPRNAELARLFEAKRADTGEAWEGQKRKISAYDLTMAPHKSVTLAAVSFL
jgi:hypothetical protein